MRDEFLQRFENSILASVGASLLAVVIGSLAAYGLSRFEYKFGPWRNKDISFFFLSQLILPPVVLAMPFLVLYKELALLDTQHRPDPGLHADGAADRHLDHARPVRHDPDRARGGGPGRRLLDLGRLPAHRAAARAARAWSPPSSSRSCSAGTSISSPPCSPARRQDPAGHGREPDRLARHQLVVDGGARPRRRSRRWPSSASSSSATSSRA